MEEIEKVEGTVVKEEDKKELVALKGEIVGVIQQAHSLTITDDTSLTKGLEIGGILTKFLRMLEDKKKKKEKKLKDYIKVEITEPFKKVIIPVKEAKDANDIKVKAYRKLKEEKQAKQQEEMRKLAKERGIEVETLPVPTIDKTVKTDFGSVTASKRWDCEVVDLKIVPDKYKTFNKTMAMKDVNRGIRNIAGLRIFQKEIISYK